MENKLKEMRNESEAKNLSGKDTYIYIHLLKVETKIDSHYVPD